MGQILGDHLISPAVAAPDAGMSTKPNRAYFDRSRRSLPQDLDRLGKKAVEEESSRKEDDS